MLLGWSFGGWRLGHGCPQKQGRWLCSGAPLTGLDHAGVDCWAKESSLSHEDCLKDNVLYLLTSDLPHCLEGGS